MSDTRIVKQESQDVVVSENRTSASILADRAVVLDVMNKCMKKGHDYGVIPGCKLPSLYKPGAEKLLSTFRISCKPSIVEDLSTSDERRYRVTTEAVSISGVFLGACCGECSSDEDKYKWKKAVCDEEWSDTPENMRREKWKSGYNGGKPFKAKQIRTSPADVSNTILQMASKRAMVATTRQVTAASDLFTQDMDDLEDLINNGGDPDAQPEGKPATKPPQEKKTETGTPPSANGSGEVKPENKKVISGNQRKRFFAIYKSTGKTDEEAKKFLKAFYGIESTKDISVDDYEAICEWAALKKEEIPFEK